MKQVIDLNGELVKVVNSTPVKTVDGKHYLLTDEDKLEIASREAVEVAKKELYLATEKYKDDRKAGYGSIQEQLDLIYWDQVNSTTVWKDHITKIKGDHPKPTA
jgi:hypothetical protein